VEKLRIGLVGRWNFVFLFVFGKFCIDRCWFEYELGFMSFMCLLICLSDLTKMKFYFFFLLFLQFWIGCFWFILLHLGLGPVWIDIFLSLCKPA